MIRWNTTNSNGTGLVIREEADGNLIGYVIGVVVESKTFVHTPHRGGKRFNTHVGKATQKVVFECPLGLASAGIWKTGREMANSVLRSFGDSQKAQEKPQ